MLRKKIQRKNKKQKLHDVQHGKGLLVIAKHILGDRLYAIIEVEQGALAGKITGMLLEGLDNSELVALIDDNSGLRAYIQEALATLEASRLSKELSKTAVQSSTISKCTRGVCVHGCKGNELHFILTGSTIENCKIAMDAILL